MVADLWITAHRRREHPLLYFGWNQQPLMLLGQRNSARLYAIRIFQQQRLEAAKNPELGEKRKEKLQ